AAAGAPAPRPPGTYGAGRQPARSKPPRGQNTAGFPPETAREANTRGGSIGPAPRRSQAAKSTTAAAPPASDPMISALPQPAAFARTRPHTIPKAAAVISASPGTSIAALAPKLSGTRAHSSTIATIARGTVSPQIHSQPA